MSANIGDMKTSSLGREIRRLRLQAGITLRGLAAKLQVSAAHLSDIEHDRRRPSEELLRKIAHQLRDVGATFASLELLVTGIDPETRDWVASTPGVRKLLRKMRESGDPPHEILRIIEQAIERKGEGRDGKKKVGN
jgi:transcriptional regulator with XRE-family HTH domain